MTFLLLIPLAAAQNSINITTDQAQYVVGSSVLISGKVLDAQGSRVDGASVSIQVNDPQNTPVHVNLVYTDQSGEYADKFSLSPGAPQGRYTVFVSASKTGLSNIGPAQTQFMVISETLTTTVPSTTSTQPIPNPSKCLIATATYGSEMAPEVAMLRDFRDSQVSHTAAGTNFMLIFNAFYYSFSPQIARYISNHSYAKPFMKVILYPTISILSATQELNALLKPNAEIAIVISGIFASFTLGFVYFGIPFGTLRLLREIERTEVIIRWLALSSITSVSLLAVGEFATLPALLMIGSSAVVLSFLALGAVTGPYLAERLID